MYVAEASTDGTGGVWTKIYEDGLSGGKWAVDRLAENKGKHSLTVPTWIAPGDYLFRAEIIGMASYRSSPAGAGGVGYRR